MCNSEREREAGIKTQRHVRNEETERERHVENEETQRDMYGMKTRVGTEETQKHVGNEETERHV